MQPVIARASVTPREGEVRRGWLAAAAAAVAAVVVATVAAGWDIGAWLVAVWDSLTSISPLYLVPALAQQTLQSRPVHDARLAVRGKATEEPLLSELLLLRGRPRS